MSGTVNSQGNTMCTYRSKLPVFIRRYSEVYYKAPQSTEGNKMTSSDSTKNIFQALVAARSKIKNMYPATEGYGYFYVSLEKIIDMLQEVLPEFKLSWIQLPHMGKFENGTTFIGLSTRIIHESGEWIEDSAEFPLTDMKGVNKSQAAGAAITYFRRYALCAAFGITGDKDIDASDKDLSCNNSEPPELTAAKNTLKKHLSDGALTDNKEYRDMAYRVLKGNSLKDINNAIRACEKHPGQKVS